MIQQAVEAGARQRRLSRQPRLGPLPQGRVKEAVPELEKAAAGEPDATVLDHLGDAYRRPGQAEKAKDAWRRAAEALQQRRRTGEGRKGREENQVDCQTMPDESGRGRENNLGDVPGESSHGTWFLE